MDLLQIKELLEKKKEKRSVLLGQQKQILETLKKDYGFSTITKAEEGLSNLAKEIKKQDMLLQKDLEKFQKEFGDLL